MDKKPGDNYYMTPAGTYRCRFSVQGSRFLGTLIPASTEKDILKAITSLKAEYPDATHHAYAFRVGSRESLIERASDDGEPAGSAGAPMLQVLQGRNISDAVVIGTRYFGGTRLGIGGLTRSYRDCARLSIEEAVLTKKEPFNHYSLTLNYEDLGPVSRLIESLEGKVVDAGYTDSVALKVKVPARMAQKLTNGFESICRGQGRWSEL